MGRDNTVYGIMCIKVGRGYDYYSTCFCLCAKESVQSNDGGFLSE